MVLLAGLGQSTAILFHALDAAIPLRAVIVEERPARRDFIAARAHRLGVGRVLGQMVFHAAVVPLLRRRSARRRRALLHELGLDDSPIPPERVVRVRSVNDARTEGLLRELAPGVVVVNGTRIIARRLIEALPRTVFLNMHAGITPLYRGVHGAYWALVQGDPEHCGVTVHRVDTGIDTGPIVAQARIAPAPADDFTTYPLLQLAAGIPLLIDAIRSARDGHITETPAPAGRSRLWTHPTALEYVRHRLRGVR